jgi:hypothetical protein
MELGSPESTSLFDILRARLGMPPIEVVPVPTQKSNGWSRQAIDAFRKHCPKYLTKALVRNEERGTT